MIHAEAIIDAPADVVWDLLTRRSRWPAWGPSITAVRPDEGCIAAGSRGHVRTALGIWLPYHITRFDAGRCWSWTVAGIPATDHKIAELGPLRTLVRFSMPSWAWFYRPVCRRALANIAELVEKRRLDR